MFAFFKPCLNFFKKNSNQKNPSFKKTSDINIILFVEQLLKDVMKWKIIAIFSLIALVCFYFTSGDKNGKMIHYNKDFIAVLEIDGIIENDSYRTKTLEKLLENENLKGVFLKINSPGGTITGSEVLYNEIRYFSKKIPVYTLIYDLGASGGYMVALGSTKIFAHHSSLTGSIGVLMQTLEMHELSKKIGAKMKTYRSALYKAQPDSFEEPQQEIDEYMQSAIMESHKFFEDIVKKSRKIPDDQIKNVANGKVFMASEALRLQLIDGISNEKDVKKSLQKKIGKDLDFKEISLKEEESKSFISQVIDEIFKQNNNASSKVQILAIMK